MIDREISKEMKKLGIKEAQVTKKNIQSSLMFTLKKFGVKS